MNSAVEYRFGGSSESSWSALPHHAPDLLVNVRLTYADEALGIPAVDAAVGRLPVALLELARWRQVMNSSNTAMGGLYVEAAVAAGLPRWTGVSIAVYRHPGWSVRARENRVELHGPKGIWAHGSADVHPDWQMSVAQFENRALALLGPILGVRVPAGTWQAQFTSEKRRRDLLGAAAGGLVTGALLECRVCPS